MESVICLEKVSKSFLPKKNARIHALREIDLTVKHGEWISFSGPSGSGKSTLLHVIGCLYKPDSGRLHIMGEEPAILSADKLNNFRGRNIGFVLQDFALIPNLSGFDNVALPMTFTKVSSAEIRMKVDSILDRLMIPELSGRLVREMSGGQRQRIAIARSLIFDAPIILADEPTGSLDPDTKNDILGIFRMLHKNGKTILFATHDKEVSDWADRSIYIMDGEVI